MTYDIYYKKDLYRGFYDREEIKNVLGDEIINNGTMWRIETVDEIYYIPIDNIFKLIVY